METIYDVIIVGSGPAGLSAAINAKIRNKKIKLFGYGSLSNKLMKAHRIDNYLGFPQVSGPDLATAFHSHIKDMGIEIAEEKITAIYPNGEEFMVMGANQMYHTKTVVLATGIELGKPIENELDLLGSGVSYCATCDAMLYKGKTVAIVGYNEEGEHEANFVAEIAAKVYYLPMNYQPTILHDSIEVVKDRPMKIEGSPYVESLVCKNTTLLVDGVFILRESVEPSQLLHEVELDAKHIKVNRKFETNIPGVFAAGDVTGRPYQYMKSAGEGHVAGLSACDYIDKKKALLKGQGVNS